MTRELSIEVAETLAAAGYQAVWAGGCVRDALLGQSPDDYDIATDATPEQVRETFGRKRTLAVGEAFGVIIVLGARDSDGVVPQVEVATFREETGYTDGRRPDSVSFCTAAEDAKRRDFTINALFAQPTRDVDDNLRANILDYVDGLRDFDARLLRAVGDPVKRFEEDKLRMLRAVRFTQRLGRDFGFTLEPATEAAIRTHATAIEVVSWERITQELTKMLRHVAAGDGFRLLRSVGLFEVLFPELANEAAAILGDLDALNAASVAESTREASLAVSLAILLRRLSGDAVSGVLDRMKVSNEVRDRVGVLHRDAATLHRHDASLAEVKPLLASAAFDDLSLYAHAVALADDRPLDAFRHWQSYRSATDAAVLDPPPLLTGGDLIAMGLKPGPTFKTLLGTVREQQLNEQLSSREEAVALVGRLLSDHSKT